MERDSKAVNEALETYSKLRKVPVIEVEQDTQSGDGYA